MNAIQLKPEVVKAHIYLVLVSILVCLGGAFAV